METKSLFSTHYLFVAIILMLALNFLITLTRIIPVLWIVFGFIPLAIGIAINLIADKAFHQVNKTVKKFAWIPEPVLVWDLRRLLVNPLMRVAMVEHAEAAHDEVLHLADEFLVQAHQTDVPTPAIDHLYTYFDPSTPRMLEGSAEMTSDWSGVYHSLGTRVGIFGLAGILLKLFKPWKE